MTRHVFTFFGTFLVGALIALAARTVTHRPYADHAAAGQGETPAAKPVPAMMDHAQHAAATPVNSVCAICGMKVDPNLPTVEYQGKTVGFGCRMCPPKFKADPDRYGPAYLRNDVLNP